MTTKNFLPEHQPQVTRAKRPTLQCLIRGKSVPATPEEMVRQRILNWLIKGKGWPSNRIKLERSYTWVGDSNRHRIRPDIELLDSKKRVSVLVECKAPQIPLGATVENQALDYARKANPDQIWITNGCGHKFLKRKSRATWETTQTLDVMSKVVYAPPPISIKFPKNLQDKNAVHQYFAKYFPGGYSDMGDHAQSIVLSLHKLLYDTPRELPYSFNGVHVLEDRGVNLYRFSNAAGGEWRGLYADFIAATSGRVESLSVAVYRWGNMKKKELRLCVGVRKAGRHHHALQMDLKHSEWDRDRQCLRVFHDGRMSSVKSQIVLEAARESGLGDWIETRRGRDYLYLGDLYSASEVNWENSRQFLANVLHLGIIRTNLRDALLANNAKKAS